jgi:hypothetical protein
MPWSSNATFLVEVCLGDVAVKAVYKPLRGERPLWDFPAGLHRREVAAYRLSASLGFGIVPPTVLRDGPYGEGSVQLFVPADFEQHYFTIHEGRPDLHPQLRAMCAFDIVANNTDRKGGHCLLVDADTLAAVLPGLDDSGLDRVFGIDNGLCFAADPKLRTVIWEFGGEPIDDVLLEPLSHLAAGTVPLDVSVLLDDDEVEAMVARASMLVARGRFPKARGDDYRSYPWPLV